MTKYLDYMKIPGRLKFISSDLIKKTCSNGAQGTRRLSVNREGVFTGDVMLLNIFN